MTATRPPICLWCQQPITGKPAYWDGRPQCQDPFRCERRRLRKNRAQPL